MDSELLSRTLLALRAGGRLSQDQIGRETELGKANVGRLEGGLVVPDRHTLRLLLHSLGVTQTELVVVSEILQRAESRRRGELGFGPPPLVAEPLRTPEPSETMQAAGRALVQGLLQVLRDPNATSPNPNAGPPRSRPRG